MALKLYTQYPGRFDPVSTDYPQGKWRNRSSSTANDGGYLEEAHMNDIYGFFGALLRNAEIVPDGTVDTARKSQFYEALIAVAEEVVGEKINGVAGGAVAYLTYNEALSDLNNIQPNSLIYVTNDGLRNGLYVRNNDTLLRSEYDPLLQSKEYIDEGLSLKANVRSPVLTGVPECPTATLNWSTPQQIANISQAFLVSRTATFISVAGDSVINLTEEQSRRPGIHFTGNLTEDVTVVFDTGSSTAYSYMLRNATTGNGNVFVKFSSGSVSTLVPKRKSTLFMTNGVEFFLVSSVLESEIDNKLSLKANIASPTFTGKPKVPTASLDWGSQQEIVNISQALLMSRTSSFVNLSSSSDSYDLTISQSRQSALHFHGLIDNDVYVNINTGAKSSYSYAFRNITTGNGRVFVKYHDSVNALELAKGKITPVLSDGVQLFPVSDYSSDISNLNDKIDSALNDFGVFTESDFSVVEKVAQNIVSAMTKNRSFGFNIGSNFLNITKDDGKTWELLHNFSGYQVEAVLPLDNGELLVTAFNGNGAYVWVSSGFMNDNLVFTKVLDSHSKFIKFTNSWSVFENDNIVLVIDYGAKGGEAYGSTDKVPYGENARYAYASLDYGKTWETIFDLNEFIINEGYGTEDEGQIQAKGVHCHGIAYDKWWDRIWITFGDNSFKIGGTVYSDDFGETWHWANKGKDSVANSPSGSRHQNVGIKPMPDCILFGSDTSPNGVHRIDRVQGKKQTGEYTIDIAYRFNQEAGLTHLCQGIYQAEHLPNSPVFFAFGAEGASTKSFLVATYDGFDFNLVWESENNMARGFGLRSIVAPTVRGNLIMKMVDSIEGVTKSFQVSGKSPTYGNKYI